MKMNFMMYLVLLSMMSGFGSVLAQDTGAQEAKGEILDVSEVQEKTVPSMDQEVLTKDVETTPEDIVPVDTATEGEVVAPEPEAEKPAEAAPEKEAPKTGFGAFIDKIMYWFSGLFGKNDKAAPTEPVAEEGIGNVAEEGIEARQAEAQIQE